MKYSDVCEAKTKEEMCARFEVLLTEAVMRFGGSPVLHRDTQLANVGYFAGYYDRETYNNVMEWLGASHPVFGKTYPIPEEALAAGVKAN